MTESIEVKSCTETQVTEACIEGIGGIVVLIAITVAIWGIFR